MQRLVGAALLMFAMGCASPRSDPAFFGRHVESFGQAEPRAAGLGYPMTVNQGGEAITAQGAITYGMGPTQLSVALANHGRRPVRMSYVVDEYIANTFSGRTIALEKSDFLAYPSLLSPGDEKAISLHLPKDLEPAEIAQLIVRTNEGQTAIVLRPLGSRTLVDDPGDIAASAMAGASPAGPPVSSVPVRASHRVPLVPEPALSTPTIPGPPIGTVPVEVEFRQVLGESLRTDVRWDALAETLSLGPGDRQTFYIVPGPHELHVSSRIPSIAQTAGRIPVIVRPDRPTRIIVEASARLTGVEMRVRVFSGPHVVVDRKLAPTPQG